MNRTRPFEGGFFVGTIMTEDDNLNAIAGEGAGENVQTSEAKAQAVADKDETALSDDKSAENEGGEPAGEDAGEKPRKQSGSARKAERIRELEAKVAELESRGVKPGDQAAMPKLEDFPDWDSHQAALIKYAAREAIKEAAKATTDEDLQEARKSLFQEQLDSHNLRMAEARQRIPDYDKALAEYRDKGNPAPTFAVEAIVLESDKSELLAYHFATRPELVRELNRMNPIAAARRIGQIESRLSYAQPKKQTDAPPPVSGLRGGASPSKDPATMGHDEFKAMFARKKG
jgi:hypothetical protein